MLTRQSQLLLPTEKRPPSDAEALSHKLMVRAGLVRQVGSGLWTWLPAGWRAHQKVVQIVREEMDAIGCQEMLMPVITPAELWRRSGRYDITEVFKLTDRRDAAGEFYSIERIGALLERMPDAKAGALYDAILADVSGFASTDEFRDDIAFVVTRFE